MIMRLYVIYGDDFGERVVGNLVNFSNFCTSCGEACGHCRIEYGSFASDIVGVDRIPANLPSFIEEPEKYLPRNPPKCDIIIAIGLHQDLLASLPLLVEKTQAKGVIVPLEDPNWCPPGLQKQVEDELNSMGVAHAFPKPFCMLEDSGHNTIIDQFIKKYKVGKPIVQVTVDNDTITHTKVLQSAPCGSTWYVMKQIEKRSINGINERISEAHHAYPCTASMQVDKTLGDTVLHVAGYAIRGAVQEAISKATEKKTELAQKTQKIGINQTT
ncbi:MAG: DUF166 domain-containing protein [Candidatus Freyarchaeota archaeon]